MRIPSFRPVAVIGVAHCLALAAVTTASRQAHAQGITRIASVQRSGSNLALAWSGTAPFYEIQSSSSLDSPKWRRVVLTAHTNSTVPMGIQSAFLRVVSLSVAPVQAVVDIPTRLRILNDINQRIRQQTGDDPAADGKEIAAYLATIPEIEDVGVDTHQSVHGRFTDGRFLCVINNREPSPLDELNSPVRLKAVAESGTTLSNWPSAASGSGTRRRGMAALQAGAPNPTGMPVSRRAVLFKATLPDIDAPTLEVLARPLTKHNYDVIRAEASLPNFMAVQDLGTDIGLFYVDSHGAGITNKINTTNAATGDVHTREFKSFLVATSTRVDEASEKLYAANFGSSA